MWIIAMNNEYSCVHTGLKQNNTLYIYTYIGT